MQETIVAAATAAGESGVGIVRFSGSEAVAIAQRCFEARVPLGARPRVAEFGKILVDGQIIDEGLGLVFPGPKSYTGEDVAEIQCHGNPLIIESIVSFAIKSGARMAEAGEFTKRAFLNGRMDLMQAEAVVDLIKAESEIGLRDAYGQAEGRLSELVKELKSEVVSALALIEVGLDFSDEDIDEIGRDEISRRLRNVLAESKRVIDKYRGRVTRVRGQVVAIIGPPNAGKSTLLNCLIGEDRAIVHAEAGTTRDTVEAHTYFGGRGVRLVDTAGLRESNDPVEIEGIRRTKEKTDEADIVLVVVDGSRPGAIGFLEEVVPTIERPVVVAVNKIDLMAQGDSRLKQYPGAVFVSGRTCEGLQGVEVALQRHLPEVNEFAGVGLTRARHADLLQKSSGKLKSALGGLELRHNDECVALELRGALTDLGLLLGENVDEDVLDSIFSEFCIGK